MNEQPDTPDTSQILEASDAPDQYGNTLSSEQAAAILGYSAQKARRLAKEGKLPARKITDHRGEAWRFERTGLLAPKQAEDPTAMVGAMMGGRDLAELVRMLVAEHQDDRRTIAEERQRNEALHQENARVREELAAERARAELAMKLLSAPASEAPKPKPWWRLW